MSRSEPRRRLFLPFVLSGFAGLVCEITWARLLRLAFGATTESVATVLAAFLAGLALGSALGGLLADRLDPRRALRLYAWVELAIAALALLCAFFLARFPEAYAGLERAAEGGRLARCLAAGALLLPPTLLMGATFPLMVRIFAGLGSPLGRSIATLYAANTAGAVGGGRSPRGWSSCPGSGCPARSSSPPR